jgi:hypothetical protein
MVAMVATAVTVARVVFSAGCSVAAVAMVARDIAAADTTTAAAITIAASRLTAVATMPVTRSALRWVKPRLSMLRPRRPKPLPLRLLVLNAP